MHERFDVTLGLSLIAKDEQDTLPHLLASVEGAFDQVALLDTGSADRTVEVFEEWAEEQDLPFGYKVDRFEWCDDFSAARNAADELLDTDWLAWADADDVVVGAERLRGIVTSAPATTVCVEFAYKLEPPGREAYVKRRDRLTRRGFETWSGRLHEGRPHDQAEGDLVVAPQTVAHWLTRRHSGRPSSRERNRRILQRWLLEEPGHPIALRMFAAQQVCNGSIDEGFAALREYVAARQMAPRERDLAQWAWEALCEQVEANGLRHLRQGDQRELRLLLSIVLGCPPQHLRDGVTWLDGEKRQSAPGVQTRQQRRAAARDKAKQLVGVAAAS